MRGLPGPAAASLGLLAASMLSAAPAPPAPEQQAPDTRAGALDVSAQTTSQTLGALPFGPGERVTMRISYAHLLAGRASVSVLAADHAGRAVLQYLAEARSQGFFAWLFRFRVNDRTLSLWDPDSGCSLGIEKHLREGRAVREQVVTFDPVSGSAFVNDPKIERTRFDVGPCPLDVLSALYVTRVRGVSESAPLELPLFDNGKRYLLAVRFRARERLNLPPPLGKRVPTLVVEPMLLEGTGLFVKERDARLRIWLTDDARRIPVRMRSKVAIGWVSADIESYQPPGAASRSPTPAP